MEGHNFGSVDEFRGHLNSNGVADREVFERVQYMKFFTRV
jgi:hypothetical protein